MAGLTSLNTAMNTLADNYKNAFGVQASGSDLMLYAKLTSPIQTNIFNTLDKTYDGDNVNGNSISSTRYFTDGTNLLFSRADNSVLLYNLPSQITQTMPDKALQAIVAPTSPEWLTSTILNNGSLIVNRLTLGDSESPVQDGNVIKLTNKIDLSTTQGSNAIKAVIYNYLNHNSDLQDLSAIFGDEENAAFDYDADAKCAIMDVVQGEKAFRVKYYEDSKSIDVKELKKEDLLTQEQLNQGVILSNYRIENGKLVYDLSGGNTNPFA